MAKKIFLALVLLAFAALQGVAQAEEEEGAIPKNMFVIVENSRAMEQILGGNSGTMRLLPGEACLIQAGGRALKVRGNERGILVEYTAPSEPVWGSTLCPSGTRFSTSHNDFAAMVANMEAKKKEANK